MQTYFQEITYQSQEYLEALSLRKRILLDPFGITLSKEELEQEKDYIHIAGFCDQTLIATLFLVPEQNGMKMRQVAVDPKKQNRGIGSLMVLFCENFLQHSRMLYCHAREHAIAFYLKNGYEKQGPMFQEVGMDHFKMVKQL